MIPSGVATSAVSKPAFSEVAVACIQEAELK